MPEGRMLKKVITTSEKVAALKSDSARLFYTWMIPFSDCEGRLRANPYILKGLIFPYLRHSPKRIVDFLKDCHRVGLITLYENSNEKCLQIEEFHTHQTIIRKADGTPKRESKSMIPPCPEEIRAKSRLTPEQLQSNSAESKVKGSKVKGSKSIAHRKTLEIFDEIWEFWWRKEDEGKAKEKFLALVNKGVDPEDIKKACIGYLRCEKSKGTGKWFIKYLKTFLYDGNEKRKIPSTWRPYVKYGDEKYKSKPKL